MIDSIDRSSEFPFNSRDSELLSNQGVVTVLYVAKIAAQAIVLLAVAAGSLPGHL